MPASPGPPPEPTVSSPNPSDPPPPEPAQGTAKKQRWLARVLGAQAANVVEWVAVIVGAVLLALVVKTFLLQAFYIPSLSMAPTLEKGDRVLVNKLSYKVHDVNRGDVVVFTRPPGESETDIQDLIKRVVGLPGDKLVIKDGGVYVDGQRLKESYLPPGTVTSTETTPIKCTDADPCVIPQGKVWVMGDNRGDSRDSRFFGPIAESSIVGRAFVIVWPFGHMGLL